jgi:hypothetical protein
MRGSAAGGGESVSRRHSSCDECGDSLSHLVKPKIRAPRSKRVGRVFAARPSRIPSLMPSRESQRDAFIQRVDRCQLFHVDWSEAVSIG